MIYLYLFGTCFHFIYVFMIICKYLRNTSTPSNIRSASRKSPQGPLPNVKPNALSFVWIAYTVSLVTLALSLVLKRRSPKAPPA